jgi:heat shock protein HslJ
MKKSIYLILIGVSIMACKTNGSTGKKEIFWVDGARVNCVGVGPMKCLQIKRTEDGSWENFYDTIEGFDYEPGYLYTLEVAINSLPKENLPADKSMLTYRLVNVVSKKPDPKIRLNDIWVATHINNSALDRSKKLPQIEMSLKKMQLMGTDGCNSIRCEINDLSENSISFGAMMGTKKMCSNMEVPNQFNNALAIVTSYNFKDLELSLYDQEGQEVLKFLKVD